MEKSRVWNKTRISWDISAETVEAARLKIGLIAVKLADSIGLIAVKLADSIGLMAVKLADSIGLMAVKLADSIVNCSIYLTENPQRVVCIHHKA